MKFHLSSVVALTLSFSGISSAQESERLKVATVDMIALVQEYHQTETTKKMFESEEARVIKERDERVERLQELKTEEESLTKQLGDPSVADTRKQALFRDRQGKQLELQSLQQELQEFLQRKSRALNEQRQLRIQEIVAELHDKVQVYAKSQAYDFVFDRSGNSVSQMPLPILLYTKDATDITGRLLETINDDAPGTAE